MSLLQTTTIGSVETGKKSLIVVKASDSVEETLAVFKKNNILSAPVQDKNGQYLGIINAVDLVTAIVFQPIFSEYDTDSKLQSISDATMKQIIQQKNAIFKEKVADFLGVSDESKTLWVFNSQDSLNKLLDAFSVGVHRILVQRDQKSVSFLSQTDILRFIRDFVSKDAKFSPVLKKSLKSLKLGGAQANKLITITPSSTALTGFRTMLQHNEITSIPIVDESGKFLDTLTVSDFRGMTADSLKYTLVSVDRFLAQVRPQKRAPVTVTLDDTLADAITRILDGGVHRLWVVEGDRPVGVVSLTDIIRKFSIYGNDD
jgi:CBS domain-containing protein